MKTRWTILPIAAAMLVPPVWHWLGRTRTITVHRAAAFDGLLNREIQKAGQALGTRKNAAG